MKLKLISAGKLGLLCTAVCTTLLAFSNNANALTLAIGDGHELGFVHNGTAIGNSDRLNYVNHLIGMALGTTDQAFGQTFDRSNHAFASLPQAVLAGSVKGTTTSVNLGAGGLYTYLFVKYGGANYGAEVWYVGDLSGVITIPAAAGRHGLSGWMLFGPGCGAVPDGGTTAMLLGMSFVALGSVRRFLKR
jgi:hypothetical protein